MSPINTASAGHDVVRAAVEVQLTHAAEVSDNLGELRNNVRKDVVALEDPLHPADDSAVTAEIRGLTIEQLGEMKEVMEEKTKEIEEVADGYEEVALTGAKELGVGVNGRTKLEEPDAAELNKDLVLDLTEMERAKIHESSKKVGHASHDAPDVPNPDVAIIHKGQKDNAVTVFEGYVERGTSIEMGEGADGQRPGQPEETYARGQRLANALVAEVGEETYLDAVREGDYGQIQKELWKMRLENAENMEDVLTVYEEAEETGYHEQAAQVINPALQRIMMKNPAEMHAAMAA